ncbi:MAG: hypothetical protein H6565_15410 [Lewinellaceae bacterium]|nr:hypothetical protein [Saprospiraceae bacterium]MCB9307985.1 hypothetical protein [Lewinellaceae bacterium]MCB9354460.1 hypothetical protein [Lewinellaceae bacterium]
MKRFFPAAFIFCLASCLSVVASAQAKVPRRTVLPASLKEVSGMVRTPAGDLWMLNDSRNPPELYRFDPEAGKVLEVRRLPVLNRDWEDLTTDDRGNLYIGDVGNNRNARKDLRIYIYNPQTETLDSILLSYPDQKAFAPADRKDWNYNCEAMVFFNDSLHLFSKNSFKGNFYTKHYVVPARPGEYVAELRDSICLKNRVVTGAAISSDNKTFSLTGYIIGKRLGIFPYTKASVFYFTDFQGSDFLHGKMEQRRLPKFLIARQYESITQWKDDCWLVANEGRKPQSQAVWRVKGKKNQPLSSGLTLKMK